MTTIIQVSRGQVTVVSDEDADLSYFKWKALLDRSCRKGNRFSVWRTTSILGQRSAVGMHRIILTRVLGRQLSRDEQVDHIDGNPLNNQRGNLRVATPSQNQHNKGKQVNNTSGFKGVTWSRKGQKWQAQISLNNIRRYLGLFDNVEDAARAYDTAAKELHGVFAKLNFSDEVDG